jgi:uncharacterized protein (DUF488 family)
MTDRPPVFTLGHSNHAIDHFLALLRTAGIEAVADVRSTPFSRFNPQYNRQRLEASLRAEGVEYLFLGEELGARSEDPACYEGGRVSYAKLAQTERFKRGLRRVIEESQSKRVALMCAEREPLDCHRTILVTRELERAEVPVIHILADGSAEPHRHAMERLVASLGLEGPDLFAEPERLFEAAYGAQGHKIAYVPNESRARQSRSKGATKGSFPRE